MIIEFDVVLTIVTFLLSLYMLRHSWLILGHKKVILHPLAPVALLLLRRLQGSEAAKRREAELRSPKENQIYGIWALIGGTLMFMISLRFLFVILKTFR
jgi:hypothetical protein